MDWYRGCWSEKLAYVMHYLRIFVALVKWCSGIVFYFHPTIPLPDLTTAFLSLLLRRFLTSSPSSVSLFVLQKDHAITSVKALVAFQASIFVLYNFSCHNE